MNELDDVMFKTARRVIVDHKKKKIRIEVSDKILYKPDQYIDAEYEKYSSIVNAKPIHITNEDKSVEYFIGRMRIAIGSLVFLNEKFIVTHQRDEHVYFYPNLFNDFAGHVQYGRTILDTLINEMIEEVLIIEDNKLIIPQFEILHVERSLFSSMYSSVLQRGLRKNEIIRKPTKTPSFLEDDLYTIEYVEFGRVIDKFKGLWMYDKKTNSIEIILPISLDVDMNKIKLQAFEPRHALVVLIDLGTFVRTKMIVFVPRMRIVKKLLEEKYKKGELPQAEYVEFEEIENLRHH